MPLNRALGQTRCASRLRLKQVAASSRARDQHISWIRQSNRDEQAYKEILKVDPLVRPKHHQVKSMLEFEGPNRVPVKAPIPVKQKTEEEEQLLRDIIAPSFKKEIGCIELGPFGRITAVHGDIFDQPGSVTVIPIPPNLTPYKGLSLEALERGGDSLLREVFSTARLMYSEHVVPEVADRDEESDTVRTARHINRGLPIGSVIPAKESLFVVMPFYWQGSSSDANQRLRFTLKRVVDFAIRFYKGPPISRLVIPNLGRGIYGYEAEWATEALVEEALEGLLQLDNAVAFRTGLTEIAFIDNDLSGVEEFKDALSTLADRWLPERRLTTAPQFLSKQSQRLIVMDEQSELSTMRRRDKYKFKQYHGKIRNLGGRYFRETLQPWIWRTQKVLEPPPLLVNEKSGEISPNQLPARPYYFRGLTHTLFPVNLRTGFSAMRRARNGRLVGVNRQPDTQKLAKPRT